jgi:RNA polymerase sigma-70 factor (ECF subfamily)
MNRAVAAEIDMTDLVTRARAADGEAWEMLYERVYPRLLAYARRRLPASEAGDAVNETMARAVASLHRFTPKGYGFEGWLFGICRNVVQDAHRSTGRRERIVPPTELPVADVDERLLAEEEAAALRRAFARLDPKDREILELRVMAGLSSEDVAAAVGKRPGAVRMAQARALERLRAHLKEEQ